MQLEDGERERELDVLCEFSEWEEVSNVKYGSLYIWNGQGGIFLIFLSLISKKVSENGRTVALKEDREEACQAVQEATE